MKGGSRPGSRPETDPHGTFTYDRLNRRIQASYAGPATVTSTYDAGHRLTQVTDSLAGTITRTYDGVDRLTQETTPQGTVSYTYDAVGRRATLTAPNQAQTTYTLDDADRLTQIVQGSQTASVAYDNANRRTSLTLPNGVVIESGYDAASRLTGLTYKLGQTTLGSLTYTYDTYDTTGNRTAVGGTWTRTGLPQTVGTASYNANNQQTAFGAATMTYDLNGNLATHTDGAGTTTYTWDSRNRLTALSAPGLTATFGYDALGRRYTKTINSARTDFLYDGLNAIQEGVLPGTPAATLLTGLGLDEVLTRTDAAGLRTVLSDALSSTLALSDNTGALPTTYTYEPFGATTVTGTASGNPVQYTGRENDSTGLYYYRARYYHPTLSRFVSEDPIEFAGRDFNRYTYVANDPITMADPLGLFGIFGPGVVNVKWPNPVPDQKPDDPCGEAIQARAACTLPCSGALKLVIRSRTASQAVCQMACDLVRPPPACGGGVSPGDSGPGGGGPGQGPGSPGGPGSGGPGQSPGSPGSPGSSGPGQGPASPGGPASSGGGQGLASPGGSGTSSAGGPGRVGAPSCLGGRKC